MIYSQAVVLTLLTSVVPIAERGAIPLGITLGLSPLLSYVLVTVGNAIVIATLLLFLKHFSVWLMQHSAYAKKFLEKVFHHTRAHQGKKFEHFGFWTLVIFVAIPSPINGVWTATVLGYLIGMPIQKAFFAILTGGAIANALVLGGTLGVIHFIRG